MATVAALLDQVVWCSPFHEERPHVVAAEVIEGRVREGLFIGGGRDEAIHELRELQALTWRARSHEAMDVSTTSPAVAAPTGPSS